MKNKLDEFTTLIQERTIFEYTFQPQEILLTAMALGIIVIVGGGAIVLSGASASPAVAYAAVALLMSLGLLPKEASAVECIE